MKPVDLFYWPVGKGVLGGMTRAATSIRVYGKERVPREGGGVLAMNHLNFIDIPVFGVVCPRRVVFVGKSELFDHPGLSHLIRAHGALPIRRGESDRDALRRMRETVRENDLLGLFIEGTRQTSGVPGEPKPGAAMIAISEGVPVIPAAIHGSQVWRPGNRAAVSVAFGEPMRFAEHARNSKGYAAASEEIMGEIKRLWAWLVQMHELGLPRHATPPRREKVPAKAQ
ncbi:MAG: lysophospholipid acyltransferase family protein [Gaiellaceae bacterium]